jgi:hypothetical protein
LPDLSHRPSRNFVKLCQDKRTQTNQFSAIRLQNSEGSSVIYTYMYGWYCWTESYTHQRRTKQRCQDRWGLGFVFLSLLFLDTQRNCCFVYFCARMFLFFVCMNDN